MVPHGLDAHRARERGSAVPQPRRRVRHPRRSILATILVVTGVGLAALGAWRYQRARTRIDAAVFEPAHWSIVLTTAAAIVTGGLAIAFVWLLHE
jgi:uncharacterized membrane protein YidH (DUF202 family)